MTLFEKLSAKAEKAVIDKAFSKGLMRCPHCGKKPTRAPLDTVTLLHCEACGLESLPNEWRPNSTGIPTAHPDQIPAGTRIQREGTGTYECIWHIPASGKFGFFLFFGLFWTAITAALSSAFLFSSPTDPQDTQPWFIYPFFTVFWAVGLGMLYAAIQNKYAHHRITVTRDLVTLRREMFGRVKEKSLITSQITSVAQVEFYQQNYQPVYGVEIRGTNGKLRFGTTLQDAEKAWLVADIKRAVFGDSEAAATASRSPEVIAAQRQSSFSFPLPPRYKGQWILSVIFLIISLSLIGVAVFNNPDLFEQAEKGEDRVTTVIQGVFGLFNSVQVIFGLVFGGISLLIIFSTWSSRNKEVRLEGDEIQVALRTYRHGRVIKEQSFPRLSVSDIRATHSGDVNGKPVKRIDLIVDGKAHKITYWTENDIADTWVADVKRALGK